MLSQNSDKKNKRSNSNLGKTLSICSAFSRVTIDQNIYADIIKNRKEHDLFLDLETEDEKEKKWHYMDDRKNIYGPYSSLQMNDMFKLYKLNDKKWTMLGSGDRR